MYRQWCANQLRLSSHDFNPLGWDENSEQIYMRQIYFRTGQWLPKLILVPHSSHTTGRSFFAIIDDKLIRDMVGISIYDTHLGYRGPYQVVRSKNHSSTLRIPNEIRSNLRDEIKAGRFKIVDTLPFAYISGPIGAVQKEPETEGGSGLNQRFA